MNQENSFVGRLIHTVPVFIAFAFHAIALNRWILVGPAMIGLVVAVLRRKAIVAGPRHWYVAAGAGLLIGLLVPSGIISAGPLPPGASSAIAGVAITVAVLAMLGNKVTVAWVAAWAVLAMSGKHAINGQLNSILLVFLLTTLVAAAWNADLLRFRVRSILTLGVFGVLTAISTAGVSFALKHIDRALVNTVENLMTRNPTSSITGLSNNITLGKRNQIKLSTQPLLELSQMTGALRSKVMDEFDGLRWTTSPELNATSGSFDEVLDRTDPRRGLEMLFLDDINGVLPSPPGTYQVMNATPRIAGGWILQGEPDGVTVTMVGSINEKLPVESQPNDTLIAVPEVLVDGLGPIARELTDSSKTNSENAEAIAAFFFQNFEYSLTTDLSGEDHPLVTLVHQRRPAYCVYFASAMAAMLRTQGIPTRVVSGFVPNELNPLTGRVTIRERDAHAWVEVWSPQENRYLAFDPTPGSSRLQATGLDEADSSLAMLIQAIRSTIRRFWLIARQDPARMMWVMIKSPYAWLAIAILSVWLSKRFRRPKTSPIGDRQELVDPEIRAVYDRYLESLQKSGIAPQPWESDQELIDRLAEIGNASLSKAANDFIKRYRAIRFGGDDFDIKLSTLAELRPGNNT